MRVFLSVIIIILSIHSWSKADDIKDFQIEGITLGDTALAHFEKSEILSSQVSMGYVNKKFQAAAFENKKFDVYDQIDIEFIADDINFIIKSLTGTVYLKDMSNCSEKISTVSKDIKNLLKIKPSDFVEYNHQADSNGKVQEVNFRINDDAIYIQCYYYSKKQKSEGSRDNFSVNMWSKEYIDFLESNPYQ